MFKLRVHYPTERLNSEASELERWIKYLLNLAGHKLQNTVEDSDTNMNLLLNVYLNKCLILRGKEI